MTSETELLKLKSRVLDLQDAIVQEQNINKQFSEVLGEAARLLKLQPDETGQITLESFIEAVKAVAPQEEPIEHPEV